MCETNDSSTRVWPPPEGSVENFDDIWDDCDLLAKYAQTEMQVKAQVEAFRSGQASLPPPPPPPPPPILSRAAAGNNATSSSSSGSQKKRRHHNKNKRKGVIGEVQYGVETTPESTAAAAIVMGAPNSNVPQAAPSAAAIGATGGGVAPVYSWLLPNLDLHPELFPPPPLLATAPCGCSHHHFLLSTASNPTTAIADETAATHAPPPPPAVPPFSSSLPLTTPNGEINTTVLLRAWYEAGYAMGQAHAEQILGLRGPHMETPCVHDDGKGGSLNEGYEVGLTASKY